MSVVFGPDDFKDVIEDPTTQRAAAKAANAYIARFGKVIYGRIETGANGEYWTDFSSDHNLYDTHKVLCIDDIPLSRSERKSQGSPKGDPITSDDRVRKLQDSLKAQERLNEQLRGELSLKRRNDVKDGK